MYLVYLILVSCVLTADTRRRRYRDCHEEPIAAREERANVVLTGTAERIYISSRGYSCDVKIKRVVKGERLEPGSSILVEGFGNDEFCDSNLKEGDTRIFLLSRLGNNLFRLNSSVIHINVLNLERVQAAAKDEPYRRRPPILDEPCEKKYCPYNGDCHFDKRIHLTSCHCPESCPFEGQRPICGSDGLTYPTFCSFRSETCRQRKKIYLRHDGICQLTRRSY